MQKKLWCIVELCMVTMAFASDQHNGYKGTVNICTLRPEKYVLSKSPLATPSASSPSYFVALHRSYESNEEFFIFDRKNNYAYLFALKNRFPNNISCQAAIVDDSLLVTAKSDSDFLCIESIHKLPALKQVTFRSKSFVPRLSSLNSIPNRPGTVSFVHNDCAVMNLDTEQVECSFKPRENKSYIQYSIPTHDGNGIWYRANNYDTNNSTVGLYDIRSGKAQTLVAEVPLFHGRISANPSNTRCAFVSSGQLLTYDVVANKKDTTVVPSAPAEEYINESFFANDNTVMYSVAKSQLQALSNTLHALTLSTAPTVKRSSSEVPHSLYFRYHDNTQLLITAETFSNINAIYDFSTKQ